MSPGVDAETHDYILTGQEDSKFGFDVASGQATEALVRLLSNPSFDVQGSIAILARKFCCGRLFSCC